MYRKHFKRIFDILLSLVALIVLSPLLTAIAIMVRFKLGSPVIFKQMRPGLNEKLFLLYKFRTMTNEKDKMGNLLPDRFRITKFGRRLRAMSLDEMPELFNILKGDMSFVGPRPLLPDYLPYYSPTEKRRHDVRPGLTGLAQINGRNYLPWDLRIAKDVQYVESISFRKDINIIIFTFGMFARRSDVAVVPTEVEGNLAVLRGKTG